MRSKPTFDGPAPCARGSSRSLKKGGAVSARLSNRLQGLGLLAGASLLVHLLWATPGASQADDPPPVTVLPGAPGEPSRILGSGDLAELERPTYTEADVRFVRGMIRHHAQALEMVELLRTRTESEDLLRLGLRIRISQEDEIELMERWLRDRNEPLPKGRSAPADVRSTATDTRSTTVAEGDPTMVPGMLTPEQMEALERERGPTFERLFLELMIEHHEGALRMVDRLFGSPGGGQVPSIYHVAAEVQSDQAMEIRRMREMLEEAGR